MSSLAERSRYAPALLLAVALAGVGVVAGDPVTLFAAVIPLAVVAFGVLVVAPPEDAVTVDRTLSTHAAAPGETVTITLTVENETDRHLPDVRLADGVPDALAVVDGSPRAHLTLAPGESTTVSYEVRAARGEATFEPAQLDVRSLAETAQRRRTVAGTDRLQARTAAEPLSVTDAAGVVGRVETDDAGDGVAFHSSREYRPGDPISRVDWNRYASTGELSTVQFHEEAAATVVLVVDDRPSVRAVAAPGERDAGQRGRAAARELATELLAVGDRVGLALKDSAGGFVSPRSEDGRLETAPSRYRAAAEGYLPPRGAGTAQETAIRKCLATRDEEATNLPLSEFGFWFADDLADRFPSAAEVVVVSPLTDDEPVAAAETWLARGHAVTVIAPDPTPESVGGQVEQTRRRERRRRLRRAGARVVDWDGTERLAAAVERTNTEATG